MNLFGGKLSRKLWARLESRALRALDSRPRIEGEARVKGAKRLRIEGEARTEGKAREKRGEGSGEEAR